MSAAASPPAAGGALPTHRIAAVALGVPLGALAFGLLAGTLISGGKGQAVVGLAVVLLPVLVWRRPHLAPAVVLLAALAIEQFPDETIGSSVQKLTSAVPLFHGLGAVHLSPADLLIALVLLLVVLKREHGVVSAGVRTPVGVAIGAVLVAVLLGLANGVAHHGDIRVSFMEVRPYVYLAATYVIASTLITNRQAVRAMLWVIVGDGIFKGAQALVVFMSVRHMVPRPDAVLGHEEALFFGIVIMLAISLRIFEVRGRLQRVATWALPLVLMGDLANSRRTAWLVLGGGLIVLAAVAYKCMPSRRLIVTRLVAVTCVGLAVYMPAFWNKSGGLAQPARAIRSIVAPSNRDASSDLYRIQEDANLKVNIQRGGMLGRGFGVPIDYPLPITDISDIDPFIAYVPHDGILYVLMRMGLLGGVAVWSLVAVGIITACKLARARERELAAIGAVVAAALVGYILEAAVDQGFFMYRVAFVVGSLLGLLEAARRLERRDGRPSVTTGRVRPRDIKEPR